MLIAQKLKEENIGEYLLYMWQIEDMIRANDLDIEKIEEKLISPYDQPANIKGEIRQWYENLIDMMRREEVVEKGHLVINKNVIVDLTDLHNRLLVSQNQSEYSDIYYKTLPFIVELRSKSTEKDISEIETCFAALYGYLIMRLQKREISGETQAAISQISSFLRILSYKYNEERSGRLDI